jgi:hypothetical protein
MMETNGRQNALHRRRLKAEIKEIAHLLLLLGPKMLHRSLFAMVIVEQRKKCLIGRSCLKDLRTDELEETFSSNIALLKDPLSFLEASVSKLWVSERSPQVEFLWVALTILPGTSSYRKGCFRKKCFGLHKWYLSTLNYTTHHPPGVLSHSLFQVPTGYYLIAIHVHML